MKKKRGGSHVGFVLSFVIFVTFLIFLYSIIIEPTRTNQDKKFVLENFKENLIENISSTLKVSSIIVETSAENCITIEGLITDLNLSSKRIIVKNEFEEIQESYVTSLGNNLEIVRSNSNNEFFKIYHSDEFGELSDIGNSGCVNKNYRIGIVKINKYIFGPNIINLKNIYNTNYEILKEKLGVPKNSDFGFGFTYNNGNIITAKKNVTINIYVEEIQVQYFDKNAKILSGDLRVRVW